MVKEKVCVRCAQKYLRYGGNTRYCHPCMLKVDRLRNAAHSLVACAVDFGLLRKASESACADCGGEATFYEHRDYFSPLDVVPICRSCNGKRGPMNWAKYQERAA